MNYYPEIERKKFFKLLYWWIFHFFFFSIFCMFQVLYCDSCRESCHPNRGPLAAHNLGPPRGSWHTSSSRTRGGGGAGSAICDPSINGCAEHTGETVCLYCAMCKSAACSLCLRDRHAAHPHDVLPLAAACKAQKVRDTKNRNKKSQS